MTEYELSYRYSNARRMARPMGIILFDIYFAVLLLVVNAPGRKPSLYRRPDQRPRDQLVGPIAFLTGDGEFLRSL